tara:strand:+ start:625 stop:1872 length:1248 start_codon:yes stop_codon:yes gene_type:complete
MNKKKYILFIHQNFPAQYKHLAPALAKNLDYEVHSLSMNNTSVEGIKHHKYSVTKANTSNLTRLAVEFESKIIRAEAAADKCFELKESGFNPDLIISHPGWGETLFMKEIWPNCKILNYFEFFYNTKESDVDFDLAETMRPEYGFELKSKLVARNAPFLSAFNQSDLMISPTNFQKSTAPSEYQDRIEVIHEGIDTDAIKPNETAFIDISSGDKKIHLTKNDKIITFVNRNLEPYRGYHIFMRSLPKIIEKHPDAYIIIIGGDDVSYGAQPTEGSYKDFYYNEIKDKIPKENNIKFLGRVEYNILLNFFAISTAHIYFTYPFVLSWSMLEAMAMETLIVGSKTPPVEEVIKNNKNGLLVNFFDHEKLSKKVNDILDNPSKFNKLKKEARKTIVDKFNLKTICLPRQIQIVNGLLK